MSTRSAVPPGGGGYPILSWPGEYPILAWRGYPILSCPGGRGVWDWGNPPLPNLGLEYPFILGLQYPPVDESTYERSFPDAKNNSIIQNTHEVLKVEATNDKFFLCKIKNLHMKLWCNNIEMYKSR